MVCSHVVWTQGWRKIYCTNFDIKTMEICSEVVAGQHSQGRGCLTPTLSLNSLTDFNEFCTKHFRFVFCCALPSPNLKMLLHQNLFKVSFSKTGSRGFSGSLISKTIENNICCWLLWKIIWSSCWLPNP